MINLINYKLNDFINELINHLNFKLIINFNYE